MDRQLAQIFRILATGFSYPQDDTIQNGFRMAIEEIAGSLGIHIEIDWPSTEEMREAYTRLFINEPNSNWAPPFSSVYLSGQGILMADGRDQAIEFYREAGLEPASDTEPEDFLATELAFVAELVEKGQRKLLIRFLNEHLFRWFPLFFNRLMAVDPHPYYLLLAEITSKLLNLMNQEVLDETT